MAKVILSRQGIYCIRNLISDRRYVGSAIRIDLRWNLHRASLRAGNHRSTRFQRSWDKHGEDAFEWTILELVADRTKLIEREQFWIDELKAAHRDHGLNMAPIAGSVLGLKMSAASKARMSAAQRGKTISAEGRANMADAARNRSPEARANMAAAQRGKKLSAETRAKLSAARKGKPKSEAHRKAIGDAHRGRTRSEEHKVLVAEGVRRHFAEHPEARERMREVGRKNGLATKGRVRAAEERARMSEVRKASPKFQATARANLSKVTEEQRRRAHIKIAAALKERPRPDRRAITYEQAEQIRVLKAGGWTYDALVGHFGLSRVSIFNIVHRKTYAKP